MQVEAPERTAAPARNKRAALPRIRTFRYELETLYGVRLKGKVRAVSVEQAAQLVHQPGAEIKKLKAASEFWSLSVGGRTLKRSELIIFTRQLAAFVRAGVPLIDALGSIGSENASRALQDTLRIVATDLAQGAALSAALAQHTKMFPAFYVDLVRAGEVTGSLDTVLDQAAGYLERQEEAQRKIRSALAYPAIIAVVALATVIILVTYVLPKFVEFFKSFDAKLPLPTRMLLGVSDWVRTWWFIPLGLAVLAAFGIVMLVKTDRGRRVWDRMLVRLPLLGPVVRYAVVERFCHTLSTMVTAGVPLVQTFQVVIDGTNNKVFEAGLRKVQEQMLVGQGMSGPIAATGLFPAIVPQMMRVGEDTGTLDDQLTMAAEFFSAELDHRIKRFTALFEPLVIVGMGLIVGFVAVALVSAMYGIYNQVGLR
jgi:type IV pilus assembly protein PilC